MLIKLGGAERVLKVLSEAFPKSPIYTLIHDEKKTKDWFKGKKIHASALQNLHKFIPRKFLLPKMASAIRQFDFNKFDTVISSNSAFAHGIEVPKDVRHICYCHSPMRYAWDYTHEYTKGKSDLMKFIIASMLNPIRQWDYESAQNIDEIIANSQHVQKRVNKYWRRNAKVIYPPVQVKKFTPRQNHEDYFLIVSALTSFKKIDIAIQAFNKIKRKLVIIGDGESRKALEDMAGDTIEFLGYKDDDVVREYFEHCRAFIFPGEEDFGITPVEAMAAGKPVLAYGLGGVMESVQVGISGEFFEKPTAESLLNGMTRLMNNERNYDYKKIRKIAEKFDESIFIEKMKKIAQ